VKRRPGPCLVGPGRRYQAKIASSPGSTVQGKNLIEPVVRSIIASRGAECSDGEGVGTGAGLPDGDGTGEPDGDGLPDEDGTGEADGDGLPDEDGTGEADGDGLPDEDGTGEADGDGDGVGVRDGVGPRDRDGDGTGDWDGDGTGDFDVRGNAISAMIRPSDWSAAKDLELQAYRPITRNRPVARFAARSCQWW
jgi:hypothetical protein